MNAFYLMLIPVSDRSFSSTEKKEEKAWERDKYSVIVNSSVATPDGLRRSHFAVSPLEKTTTPVFYFPAKVNSEHLQVK